MNKIYLFIALALLLNTAAITAQAAGPAARHNDPTTHKGGKITEGSPDVFINGQAAARVGDFAYCPLISGLIPHVGGDISTGSSTVFINKIRAARSGDTVPETGATSNISLGSHDVIIGD